MWLKQFKKRLKVMLEIVVHREYVECLMCRTAWCVSPVEYLALLFLQDNSRAIVATADPVARQFFSLQFFALIEVDNAQP